MGNIGKVYQFHTSFSCSFGSLIMGLLNVWPSYTLSLYTAENSKILNEPMSELESSLVGSLPSLGAMLGTAVVGPLIDRIGRKRGGVAIMLPYVLSWAIIGQTSTSIVILIARFLSGVSGGAALVFAPMFISEIADNSIRGILASLPLSCYCLGTLFSYLFGWFLSYEVIIKINIAVSVVGALLAMSVAESPVFLLRQNKEEDARGAIAHYRGATRGSKVVLEELSRLKQQVLPAVELVSINGEKDNKEDGEQKTEDAEKEKLNTETNNDVPEETQKMSAFKMLFVSASSRRAFSVVMAIITIQVFMGLVPVQVYAKDLFAQAVPNLSSHFCSVLFAIVITSGSLSCGIVADKAGRRFALISSAVLVSVFMVTLGVLLQTSLAPAWVSAMVILFYCFSFTFGAGSIPYVLLAEVFIPEVQSLASMLIIEWVWFLNFFIIAVFPYIKKILGIHGVFFFFAGMGVLDAVTGYLILPETKGLANTQIQEAFLKRRRK